MSERLALVSVGSVTLFDHMLPVDELPHVGDAMLLHKPAGVSFGGCGVNQVVDISGLGLPTATAMCAGDDFRSSGYEARLVEFGIDVSGITIVEGESSGHSYIVFDRAGDSFIVCETGVARLQDGYAPPAELLARADAVVLNMPFDRYCAEAARIAREAGAIVVACGQLLTVPADAQQAVLESCTHLSCNEPELRALLRDQRCTLAELLATLDGAWVTDGAQGARALTADGAEDRIPVVTVPRIHDTNGAGDAFTACAAVALTRGATLAQAARVGAVGASFLVETEGCQRPLDPQALAERYERAYGESFPIALARAGAIR